VVTKASTVRANFQSLQDEINAAINRIIPDEGLYPQEIYEALRYSVSAPGKRIRPLLLILSHEVFATHAPWVVETGCAVEFVHTYSLIHDDLPAIDNDDMRRGRPSCHKAFGEAMAILAGDALLTLGFEVIADKTPSGALAQALIAELAQAVGIRGMIGGQAADILCEGAPPELDKVEFIHTNKTAKFIAACCRMGALCAGATRDEVTLLGDYGLQLGLAFQVADDILDVTGDARAIGKATRKDSKQGKLTFPAVVGLARSQEIVTRLTDLAIESLADFGQRADNLKELAEELALRT